MDDIMKKNFKEMERCYRDYVGKMKDGFKKKEG